MVAERDQNGTRCSNLNSQGFRGMNNLTDAAVLLGS